MYCLWCHEEIVPDVTWRNLFSIINDEVNICPSCREKLTFIDGPTCPTCSRPQETKEICADCKKWQATPSLVRNVSVFTYSTFMKEWMARWKYRGDYKLIYMVKKEIQAAFVKAFGKEQVTLVPIPLSEERLQERGFNQAEAIASVLPRPILHPLTRIHSEKQAKKSRQERLKSPNPFRLKESISGNIVLIDDLYTTGATLHWAAELLLQGGAESVRSFTLIRS